jgi:hypothetical protein
MQNKLEFKGGETFISYSLLYFWQMVGQSVLNLI